MKVICSALFVLLASQAVLGNVVPRNDVEDEDKVCAIALFDRLGANIQTQVHEVRDAVIALKAIYEGCNVLPYPENIPCLRNFSQIFIDEARKAAGEVQERRDNFTLYTLERLTDYHACRLEQNVDAAVQAMDARETLCAFRFIEEAEVAFSSSIEAVSNVWYRLNYEFLQCYIAQENYQPRCFMNIAQEARSQLDRLVGYLAINRDRIFNTTDYLLNHYYQCRINYTPDQE